MGEPFLKGISLGSRIIILIKLFSMRCIKIYIYKNILLYQIYNRKIFYCIKIYIDEIFYCIQLKLVNVIYDDHFNEVFNVLNVCNSFSCITLLNNVCFT